MGQSFYPYLLVAGLAAVAWMVRQAAKTISSGVIVRHPPLPNFTRHHTPGAFWAVVGLVALSICGISWGLVVAAFRYFTP
jgi:hypothetical protein